MNDWGQWPPNQAVEGIKGMQSRGTAQLGTLRGPVPNAVADADPALLAALAAVLVEYRRCAGQVNGGTKPEGASSTWRSIARWEQLQGQA